MLHVIENLIGGYDDKQTSPAGLRDYANKAFHVDESRHTELLALSRSYKPTARLCIRVCTGGFVVKNLAAEIAVVQTEYTDAGKRGWSAWPVGERRRNGRPPLPLSAHTKPRCHR